MRLTHAPLVRLRAVCMELMSEGDGLSLQWAAFCHCFSGACPNSACLWREGQVWLPLPAPVARRSYVILIVMMLVLANMVMVLVNGMVM